MPKKARSLALGLLIATLSACFTTHKRLDNIPLLWKPTSDIQAPAETSAALLATKIQFEKFQDTRKQPELIAENREDATPKPVTTQDNVGDFVSAHMRTVFDRMGLKTVDNDGDVIVSGEVQKFFVDETNTYQGHIALRITIKNAAGKLLWSGNATGVASRFGHSYSAENYYEVFSDSIINAVTTLFQDGEFQSALTKK